MYTVETFYVESVGLFVKERPIFREIFFRISVIIFTDFKISKLNI
jgi:hypothetical protein